MTATTVYRAASVEDVAAWLAARPGAVRVRGGGSRQAALPPADGAAVLDLSALAAIVRLDPGDQTCTVECGVPRPALDAALAEHALELPCLGGGTIGGLFATDPFGPAAPAALGPRSLLLGMDAVLADGTPFRSGARVVKSVAGFDVHKLFVGSAGRLFVATRLHLRLKPQPRAAAWFRNAGLERAQALELLAALRRETPGPAVLQLARERDGAHAVAGRIAGRAGYVAATVRHHGLCEVSAPPASDVDARPADEVVRGCVRPSALGPLLAALPDGAPCVWLGGGCFAAALADPAATDALLAAVAAFPAAACIVQATPARRGRGTLLDPGQLRLQNGLKRALDPDAILV